MKFRLGAKFQRQPWIPSWVYEPCHFVFICPDEPERVMPYSVLNREMIEALGPHEFLYIPRGGSTHGATSS